MNRNHQSGVFMMEMIAVVLFFILCAAICIQTFAKADSMSRRASDLNQGVLIAQSIAEVWKAEGEEGLENRFEAGGSGQNGEAYVMGFDKDGVPCKPEDGVFQAKAGFPAVGQAEVTVSRNGKEVYSLLVYRQEIKE